MKEAVLLAIAHGSVEPAAGLALESLMDRVRARSPGRLAELAYVDHTAPSVSQALARLAPSDPVIVVPLLLSAASHSKSDIPAAISAARLVDPARAIAYGRPLGPHPLLLAALDRLLREAGATSASAVILLAAGSADPDANADVAKMARLLWEWRGGAGPVEPAFASATSPGAKEALERLHRLGHRDVVVAPYFLAPGRLPLSATVLGVPMSGYLADTDEVADLVEERFGEAATTDVRMNCDVCRYRTPWPGRGQVVGAAQVVHAHPADR